MILKDIKFGSKTKEGKYQTCKKREELREIIK